jgi:hypothetical protein
VIACGRAGPVGGDDGLAPEGADDAAYAEEGAEGEFGERTSLSELGFGFGMMRRATPTRAKARSAPGRPSQAAKRAISLASPRPMPSRWRISL